eukprot:1928572-Pleurochrysis_carterae.AAC.2
MARVPKRIDDCCLKPNRELREQLNLLRPMQRRQQMQRRRFTDQASVHDFHLREQNGAKRRRQGKASANGGEIQDARLMHSAYVINLSASAAAAAAAAAAMKAAAMKAAAAAWTAAAALVAAASQIATGSATRSLAYVSLRSDGFHLC